MLAYPNLPDLPILITICDLSLVVSVSAENATLGSALVENDRYLKLPRFQRKYKWPIKGLSKDDDVTNLFDDIVNNMARTIPSKFIGSILIHDEMQNVTLPKLDDGQVFDEANNNWRRGTKADFQDMCSRFGVAGWNLRTNRGDLIDLLKNHRREKKAEIIDGQQRLTTLSLMAVVVKFTTLDNAIMGNRHRALNATERRAIRSNCESLLEGVGCRLTLHVDDQLHYENFLAQGFDYNPPPGRGGVIRIATAVKKIRNRLTRQLNLQPRPIDKLRWLKKFTEWLVNKVELVWVVVPNKVQAHLVFQSLNSRGLPLALSELVNSYLQLQADMLSGPGSTIMEDTTTALSNIETILDDDEEAIEKDFYYRYWLSKVGWVSKEQGEVLAGFIQKITSLATEADLRTFLGELEQEAQYYTRAVNATILGVPDTLQDLNAIQKQHRVLFMAGQRAGFVTADWVELVRILELFLVRYSIAGSGKPPDQDWSDWSQLINSDGRAAVDGVPGGAADNIETEIKSKITNVGADDNLRFQIHMGEASLRRAEAKFLIRRILGIGFAATYNTSDFQAEHIAPESHTLWPAANWNFTKKQKLKIKGSLGNFLVLTSGENRYASNKRWAAKKRIYAAANLPSGLHARDFAADNLGRSPWTPATIRARTTTLAALMPGIWVF